MGKLDETLSVQKYFPFSTVCKLNYWIVESKVSYLTKVLYLSAYLFCRHVEVRTNAPQGYVFTIKVSEDMSPGSVGFSLVQVTDWHPFISGAWSVYECATKQNKKKTVLYMYFKFQYSAHVYHKIPKISPGAYIFQRSFLRGLFFEGLIFGGAYLQREICVSKSIGLAL